MIVANPTRRGGEAGFTLIELLVVLAVIATLAMIAIQGAYYAFDAARLSRTVANMRQVASAIMQYESSTSELPGAALAPVSSILPALGSQAGGVPSKDGWNNDLYYEPVTSGGTTTFRVYCYGKDATPDGTITGVWQDFFTDIAVEGGVFIQTKW